jgi:3-oxoacyl-[acyl-carrier protein] reductase
MMNGDVQSQENLRVALITGSGRGIGQVIALSLAEAGWHIVINDIDHEGTIEQTIERINAFGVTALKIFADVSQRQDRDRLVDSTLECYGRVDLLVNNAGIAPRQRVDILQMSEESYDEVLGVNLRGPFFLTQRIANEMIRLVKKGKISNPMIVNVSSISSYTSSPTRAEYCISKAGVSMMTKLWADRLSEFGIHVYEIRPGIILTDMTESVKEKYDQLILEEGVIPIKRWGLPQDIAKAILAIAQGMLPYSTGEVINVDGGFHLRRL